MKIPKEIYVAGRKYVTEYIKQLNTGTQMAYGHIDYEQAKIELEPDIQNHEGLCITYLHELLHLLIHQANIEVKGEEGLVTSLSRGLYQVLQDNGRKFFDIVPLTKK